MVTDRTGVVYKCPFCPETDTDLGKMRSHINNSKSDMHSGVTVETMDRPIETVTEEDFEDASSETGKMSFDTPDTEEMLDGFLDGPEEESPESLETTKIAPGYVLLNDESVFALMNILLGHGEQQAAKDLYNNVMVPTDCPSGFTTEEE